MFSGCSVPAVSSRFYITLLKIMVEVTTSEMPQVCKLRFGVGKGLLPVNHLASNVLVAIVY